MDIFFVWKGIKKQHVIVQYPGWSFPRGQNKALVWPYITKSDVGLYQDAKHNDVITSCEFSINGCIFYLECTPKVSYIIHIYTFCVRLLRL